MAVTQLARLADSIANFASRVLSHRRRAALPACSDDRALLGPVFFPPFRPIPAMYLEMDLFILSFLSPPLNCAGVWPGLSHPEPKIGADITRSASGL